VLGFDVCASVGRWMDGAWGVSRLFFSSLSFFLSRYPHFFFPSQLTIHLLSLFSKPSCLPKRHHHSPNAFNSQHTGQMKGKTKKKDIARICGKRDV
jgi:hypothetical protein